MGSHELSNKRDKNPSNPVVLFLDTPSLFFGHFYYQVELECDGRHGVELGSGAVVGSKGTNGRGLFGN